MLLTQLAWRGGLPAWLRNRGLHFAVLGTALFLLRSALAPVAVDETARRPVVISAERIAELRGELRRRGVEPDPALLRARVQQEVDEEILYREARRLALDVGDPSVRRRLVQKMLAVSEDPHRSEEELVQEARNLGLDEDAVIRRLMAEKMRLELRRADGPETLSEDALSAVLDRERERFAQPAEVTLIHVFVAGEPGAGLSARAARLRREIGGRDPSATDLAGIGDAFPLGGWLRSYSRARLQARFGHSFAEAVFALEPGGWSTPLASPYGMHLVWVTEKRPERRPPLEDVRRAAALTLVEDREAARLEAAMRRMRRFYEVRIESPDGAARSPEAST